MSTLRAGMFLPLAVAAIAAIAGCGRSTDATNAPTPPPIPKKPDVLITLDGDHHACMVALPSEAQGSTIACDEVVSFMKDELRLATGSIYDIRTLATVPDGDTAKVKASLDGAGYRFMGGTSR